MNIPYYFREVRLGKTDGEKKEAIKELPGIVLIKQKDSIVSCYEAGTISPHPRDDENYFFQPLDHDRASERRPYKNLQKLLVGINRTF